MPRSGSFLIAVLLLTISVLLAVTQCASRQDGASVAMALDRSITPGNGPLPPGRDPIELEPASDPAARAVVQDATHVARTTVGVVTATLDSKRPASMTEPGMGAISGRVLSASGVPVSGAEVVLLEVDWRGNERSQDSLATKEDGCFEFSVERIGFVSVYASHEAHGIAKRDRTREEWQSSIDLGDIALARRGVLAGRVVGFGDEPLGRCTVAANPADEHSDFDWFETLADDDGCFRFAVLERIPYTLAVEYEPSGAVFTPDTEGIVLHVALPSALVTVLGPEGVVFTEFELDADAVRRANKSWRRAPGIEGWWRGPPVEKTCSTCCSRRQESSRSKLRRDTQG